jgi:hypothetical protein
MDRLVAKARRVEPTRPTTCSRGPTTAASGRRAHCIHRASGVPAVTAASGRPSPEALTHPIEGGNANDYDYVAGDPINQYDLDGQICWSCHAKKLKKAVKRGARYATSQALRGARALGGVASRNRDLLLGLTVSATCVASGGAACAIGSTALFLLKANDVRRRKGGWRVFAAASLQAYSFALPGAALRGSYNTAAWRALAEAPGLTCLMFPKCR